MSTVIRSKSKVSRKYGVNLWGKTNCAFEKKPYRPGQHRNLRRGNSDYAKQMLKKQKVKFYYLLSEKTLRRVARVASASLMNSTEYILSYCESLSYVILYRAGLAPTMFSAKQLVSHGHISVNGVKVNIPSFRMRAGDVVKLSDKAIKIPEIATMLATKNTAPDYLDVDFTKGSATLKNLPKSESEVPYESQIAILSVIEYYSR